MANTSAKKMQALAAKIKKPPRLETGAAKLTTGENTRAFHPGLRLEQRSHASREQNSCPPARSMTKRQPDLVD